MAEEKIKLSKKDRLAVIWRSTFIQGSWDYERMQNSGQAFFMISAIKKLYKAKEERSVVLRRRLEFFNTHPYIASLILGITLALEEERANGAPVDDVAIQGVKVGMVGSLADVGDPVLWFTVRPMLGALGASLAMERNTFGPIIFLLGQNIIRWIFIWRIQESGCKTGSKITDDPSGELLQDVTKDVSILGMFILAAFAQRWVSIKFLLAISTTKLDKDAYIEWNKLPSGDEGTKSTFKQVNNGLALSPEKVTTLQDNLNQLTPGLAILGLTLLCMWLLKKKVSPIVIVLGLLIAGVVGYVIGLL